MPVGGTKEPEQRVVPGGSFCNDKRVIPASAVACFFPMDEHFAWAARMVAWLLFFSANS
jgi:hypothetical protein